MGFVSAYIQELHRYSLKELQTLLSLTPNETEKVLTVLKAYGVVKSVKNCPQERNFSEITESNLVVTDVSSNNDTSLYVFTYVGVITIANRVLKCYPKYITKTSAPLAEMKQILKVLQLYAAKEQIISLYNGDDLSTSFNLLAVILFILSDYQENGLYINCEDIIENNGEGPIIWDKTINEGFSIIRGNKPYYIDYFTTKTIDDEFDYFTRLHKYIVTEGSKLLSEFDLIDLFELPQSEISDEKLHDFGETEYILYRIQGELSQQFNTHKQIVLKTLYAYIANRNTKSICEGVTMYGTTTFNLVWENVCSTVFNSCLYLPLGRLLLPCPLSSNYDGNARLITVIESPIWVSSRSDGSEFTKRAADTLIPDSVIISGNKCVILDAKYYCPQIMPDKPLVGQPGISDITKQYLYQLALMPFLQDHNILGVKNCFLMPTENEDCIRLGYVKMEMLDRLSLCRIQVRQVPAMLMYEHYINHRTLDISYLQL